MFVWVCVCVCVLLYPSKTTEVKESYSIYYEILPSQLFRFSFSPECRNGNVICKSNEVQNNSFLL